MAGPEGVLLLRGSTVGQGGDKGEQCLTYHYCYNAESKYLFLYSVHCKCVTRYYYAGLPSVRPGVQRSWALPTLLKVVRTLPHLIQTQTMRRRETQCPNL